MKNTYLQSAIKITKFMIFSFLTVLGIVSLEALLQTEYPKTVVISFFGLVLFFILFYYLDKE